ncbi:hypothetical protein BGZ65_011024, partial [Modicella reniformis]
IVHDLHVPKSDTKILVSRIQALEEDLQVLRKQYQLLTGDCNEPYTYNNTLLSHLWKLAGQSIDKFKDLVLEQEGSRANKVDELAQTLAQLIPPGEVLIQLAQIRKDERIRLAEIAADERLRLWDLFKNKQEITSNEHMELARIARDEKIRLAELAKEKCTQMAAPELEQQIEYDD